MLDERTNERFPARDTSETSTHREYFNREAKKCTLVSRGA